MFRPLQVGPWPLPHRVVMAPLTRCRAGEDRVPTPLMATYYAQRAAAAFIVSEATPIMAGGVGHHGVPGIWNDAQVAGWRRVTDAVHDAGGTIVAQLWHVGRTSHSHFQPGGALPVGPSAIAAPGRTRTPDGPVPYEVPRALEDSEIKAILAAYGTATTRAKEAGFDGVEVHGANGYLPDQFLWRGSNTRTDRWGGSVENRMRFLLEAVDAAAKAWSPNRVGIRISPNGTFNGISDPDRPTMATALAEALNTRGLAYLHVIEALPDGHRMAPAPGAPRVAGLVRDAFTGPLILNGGYSKADAEAAIAAGQADLIAFGIPFISNPDLPERFKTNAPLADADPSTFYGGGARGYTDYPPLSDASTPDKR